MKKLILGLALVGMILVAPASPADPKSPAILVVDLQQVLNDCQEAKDMLAKIDVEIAAEKKVFTARVKKLEEQKRDLQEKNKLSERDVTFYESFQSAVKEETELKARYAFFQARMADDRARKIHALMKGAREQAKKIMKARGASLVLVSKMGPFQFDNDQEYQAELVFRRVLVASRNSDITKQVIKGMNDWWKANKPIGKPSTKPKNS